MSDIVEMINVKGVKCFVGKECNMVSCSWNKDGICKVDENDEDYKEMI